MLKRAKLFRHLKKLRLLRVVIKEARSTLLKLLGSGKRVAASAGKPTELVSSW